ELSLARIHEQPAHWQRYYHAHGTQLELDLSYSLSDRIRYYWPDAVIERARQRLFANLRDRPPPLPLLSQHLPHALHAMREGRAPRDPHSLVMAHVATILDDYHRACHPRHDHS